MHRDLKPANFLVGNRKRDKHIIYLIDFGLCKVEDEKVQPIDFPDDEVNRVVGTAVYASMKAHRIREKYVKKDDLESMMYVLSHLAVGSLPWKHLTKSNEQLGLMEIMKQQTKGQQLFPEMPK